MADVQRTPVIAGNWKMNKFIAEAAATTSELVPLVSGVSGVEIIVCPVFTALSATADAAKGSNVEVGAQNCYTKESGAYTGEISPHMIKDAGCQWTIIGHSERREYFKESNALLNEKCAFALANGLKVMFCIGETLEQREGGQMNDVLRTQLVEGLRGRTDEEFKSIVIAYEPVWAIGTGVTATVEQAQEAHAFVRGVVRDTFGDAVADAVRIQYGGSVKPDNAGELIQNPDVDGFLVGGAALQAESFAAIIKAGAAN